MLQIKQMKMINPYSFTIEWSDGIKSSYQFYDLQKACPCHQCRDPRTGAYVGAQPQLHNNVEGLRIATVGNYAIKIHFKSGCSFGIYDYHLLRSISSVS